MSILIEEGLEIPEEELRFSHARSSGPGGQNVNKVSTKVLLRFDVVHSPSLSEAQRARILERLATRINRDGILQLSSQRERSQSANQKATVERFRDLLRHALERDAPRHETRIPRAARRRRLDEKRHRGQVKRLRDKPRPGDD